MLKTRDDLANLVLLSLPQTTIERIRPALELRDTKRGEIVQRADEPFKFIYFINRGLVSLVKGMKDGRTVEVGAVGIEGIAPPCALLGLSRSVVDAVVEIPGTVFRIRHDILMSEIERHSALRAAVGKYARYSLIQLMQAAACNRLHHIDERCCRWLLTAQDNASSDTFPLTQEYLAMLLGVQRAGLSEIAHALQEKGLITYRRGKITIQNRAMLEALACECYDNLREARLKVFGNS